jgi:hypothetical protein
MVCPRECWLDLLGPLPILLDCGDFHKGIRYFKFKDMCLKFEGFVDRAK